MQATPVQFVFPPRGNNCGIWLRGFPPQVYNSGIWWFALPLGVNNSGMRLRGFPLQGNGFDLPFLVSLLAGNGFGLPFRGFPLGENCFEMPFRMFPQAQNAPVCPWGGDKWGYLAWRVVAVATVAHHRNKTGFVHHIFANIRHLQINIENYFGFVKGIWGGGV